MVGVNAGLAVERDRAGYWEMYRRVMNLYDHGKLRPQVTVIPFGRAVAGFDAIRERRAFGKYVSEHRRIQGGAARRQVQGHA